MRRPLVILAIAVGAVLVSPHQGFGQVVYPVRFKLGWETRVVELTTVAPKSAVAASGLPAESRVYYAYDQLTIISPLWSSSGRYVAELPANPTDNREAGFYEFEEQNPTHLAKLLGVSEESLDRPFSYFIPQGWLIVGVLVAVVVIRRRYSVSPHERFRLLWADSRYRAAAAAAFGVEGVPSEGQGITLDRQPTDLEAGQSRGVDYLVSQGVTRWVARREIEFVLHYLINNQLAVVVPPPEQDPPNTVMASPT